MYPYCTLVDFMLESGNISLTSALSSQVTVATKQTVNDNRLMVGCFIRTRRIGTGECEKLKVVPPFPKFADLKPIPERELLVCISAFRIVGLNEIINTSSQLKLDRTIQTGAGVSKEQRTYIHLHFASRNQMQNYVQAYL